MNVQMKGIAGYMERSFAVSNVLWL